MVGQEGKTVRKKLLLISAKHLGVEPVDNFGQTEPKPTTTFVEKIWNAEYCRQHPQNAAKAIETLQMLLEDTGKELHELKESLSERI